MTVAVSWAHLPSSLHEGAYFQSWQTVAESHLQQSEQFLEI